MADYQGISDSIFDEPEYRDATELVVSMYIMLNRDMAGVCPISERIVARRCRTSVRKLREVLAYFEQIGKVEISVDKSHVWLKSGIAHSLFKGRCSVQQKSNVVALLSKWNETQLFGSHFAMRATQLVAVKYSIVIPYTEQTDSYSYTETETEADIRARGASGGGEDLFIKNQIKESLQSAGAPVQVVSPQDPEIVDKNETAVVASLENWITQNKDLIRSILNRHFPDKGIEWANQQWPVILAEVRTNWIRYVDKIAAPDLWQLFLVRWFKREYEGGR